MQYRYFQIRSGPVYQAMETLKRERELALKAHFDFATRLGASAPLVSPQGKCVGMAFDIPPDLHKWKAQYQAYTPRANTREGKALVKAMQGLPPIPDYNRVLSLVGLEGYCIEHEHRLCKPSVCAILSDRFFMRYPQAEISPRWQAPADWQEVKEWEMARVLDERHVTRAA